MKEPWWKEHIGGTETRKNRISSKRVRIRSTGPMWRLIKLEFYWILNSRGLVMGWTREGAISSSALQYSRRDTRMRGLSYLAASRSGSRTRQLQKFLRPFSIHVTWQLLPTFSKVSRLDSNYDSYFRLVSGSLLIRQPTLSKVWSVQLLVAGYHCTAGELQNPDWKNDTSSRISQNCIRPGPINTDIWNWPGDKSCLPKLE